MFFDRIARSFELARSSWRVIVADKKLVLFPIFSGIATVLVVASFFIPLGVLAANGVVPWVEDADGNVQPTPWSYAIAFAFYFCTYFVIIFFNSALVSCALMRFNGQSATLGDGFRAAGARLPQIFAWALVSATVGLLLRMIESANERVGRFISAILGTAWTIMTYFVVPVLVVEKTGPIAAVSRSVALMKKTWGEALVGHFGLGFYKFLLVLPGILILLLGGYLLSAVATPAIGFVVLGLGVVYLMIAFAIGATLQTIFVAALYQYAAYDQVPEGFDRDTIANVFESKPA
jgi:hypothetical protein